MPECHSETRLSAIKEGQGKTGTKILAFKEPFGFLFFALGRATDFLE